ncbi:MlaD family protein [Sulfitobacter sp. D35]|uniref:MlaD family protein n=1 Tax=Sulfitobacter sp. D35 TaxID=3083252 RepID=UPI00296F7E29|nr:MlaD family protein [Sulfitobacter sp. D35]MDW4499290.1 MlaD family protein [Sulfitobacter sp. D35]
MTDGPSRVDIEPSRPSLWQRASAVWIIPVIALVAALGVAWQSYNDRGPIISIIFENGAGIKANETELRYRDVTVGLVEDVDFSADLSSVVARVRIDKGVAPFLDAGATFWVVRPEVTTRGITGLDTVLTGVFIEGSWDSEIGPRREEFRGLSEAPLYRPGDAGLQIALRSIPGQSLAHDVPILFRGIEVGRVGKARISPNGNFAIAEALIYEPHGRLITASTRFWDVSGFTFSVSPSGAEIDFSSIATLVSGGITFDTFVSGGERVSDGSTFDVFPDIDTARNSVFNASEVAELQVRAVFEDNIAGLAVGAPVELNGLKIGTVQSVNGIVDADAFGDNRVRLNAVLAIQPARLGLQGEVTPDTALAFLDNRVREGVRARLVSASILTGGLKVELVQQDNPEDAEIEVPDTGGPPVVPTMEAEVSDAAATLEGVFNRVNSLPIEDLLQSAIRFMDNARALIGSEEIRETPAEIRGLIGDIRAVVQSEEVQQIPVTLNAAIARIETVIGQIETEQVVRKVTEALDEAVLAAANIRTGTEGVPALVDELNRLAANAADLPLDQLAQEVTDLVASAEAVIGTPAARELPADLGAALDEINATLREFREAGTVAKITATLDEAVAAAANIRTGTEGVGTLVEELNALAAKANDLPLDQLTQEVTDLVASAEAVIGTPAARELPEDLGQALEEINATLAELREGGAVGNINATLGSVRNAADRIAVSADDLPALVARMTRVLDQASNTIAGYDRGEALSRDAQAALRDISQAADALTSLARMLERNPSSLIRGR